MEFVDVVRHQRACRAFRSDPVPWDVVRRILVAATHAPSAENRQPWRFVVVTDAEARERLGELTRRAWDGGARQHSAERLDGALLEDVDRGATGGVAGAPVLVVVALDRDAVARGAEGPSVWPAVQNLLLAANDAGLGSALTTLPALAFPDEVRATTGMPDRWTPEAVVPLGYPEQPLGAPRRRPVDEVAWHDRVGTPLPPG